MKNRSLSFLSLVSILYPLLGAAQSDPGLADIVLPEGFSIEVFAEEIPNARSMTAGDNGTVFVSTRSDGRVFAIRPGETGADRVVTIAKGLRTPNGIDFFDGDLYVAETRRLIRFVDIEENLDQNPDYEVLDESFPTERHHGWRYIKFGPDGKLYMSIGAPCNVCDLESFGIIQRMDPDGSNKETVAYGVRNSVGLEFHPETGELWFTDNGRDMLGDDVPPGELNRASSNGQHFGFPFCHGGEVSGSGVRRPSQLRRVRATGSQAGSARCPSGAGNLRRRDVSRRLSWRCLYCRARLLEPVQENRLSGDGGAACGRSRA